MEMSCCDNRLYSLVSTVEKKKKKIHMNFLNTVNHLYHLRQSKILKQVLIPIYSSNYFQQVDLIFYLREQGFLK